MAKRTDCIYCGKDTGSREHMFLAALGGRRMNKGILCGECNGTFSSLDARLTDQLRVVNGFIGVRHDRDEEPRPARVESPDGPLTIDHGGKPAFATPRVVSDDPLPDGRRAVRVLFASEEQRQEWVAQQRAAGLEVRQVGRGPAGQRFITEAIPVGWSFGGPDAFREIGRIALNFLAHRWPDVARLPELRPFKDFVEGKLAVAEGEPRFVWYARPDVFELPRSPFQFGHQVLVVVDPATRQARARVRFFSVFDLCVWFGSLPVVEGGAVLFDIDPLAEHPPDDLNESALTLEQFPALVPPTTETLPDIAELMRERLRVLLSRIEGRQWEVSTQGLLEALNAAGKLPAHERAVQVANLLRPHAGQVLFLARYVADEFRKRAKDGMSAAVADALDHALAPDQDNPSGLSPVAEASLELAMLAVAHEVASDLGAAPLTNERLRLLLHGGPGAYVVGKVLMEQILAALVGSQGA